MDTGPKISAALHGGFLLAAMIGGPLFNSEDADELQVSEVSLISSAELAALSPSAEAPQNVPTPQEPEQPEALPEAPTRPTPEPIPEQTESPEPPQSTAQEATPIESPEAEIANEAVGVTDVQDQGQVSEEANTGEVKPDRLALVQPKPRPANRIADRVREATEAAAKAAAEAAAAVPEPTEVTPEPQPEAAAEPESTTEIVTEAEEIKQEAEAPVKTVRPKGRPIDLAKKIEKLKEEQEAEVEETPSPSEEINIEEQIANDIAAAVAAAAAEAQASETAAAKPTPTSGGTQSGGSPLSQSESEGLIFQVQQCWNVPVAIQNAKDLKVTLKISLARDGFLKSSPTLIDPVNSGLVGVQHAYEAGRRALIRCQPFRLPAEKYETWKEIEIVFNPQKMVLK